MIAVSAYTAGLIAVDRGGPRGDVSHTPRRRPAAPTRDRYRPSGPTFVTVARLADRYKGHDVLVRALALVRERVPDVEWAVIGDGPLRARARSARALARRGGRGPLPGRGAG